MKSFGSKPWILPQPVLIIGTYDKEGRPNAMNAAWGGTWDMKEIMISLSSHATTDNLAVNDTFTVAFATTETMVASDFVGIVSAKKNVNAPLFTDFPMTMECRVKEKIDEDRNTGYYLIAEVVNVLCHEQYLDEEGNPDIEKMHIITYDPTRYKYVQLGTTVGTAFHDGAQLK